MCMYIVYRVSIWSRYLLSFGLYIHITHTHTVQSIYLSSNLLPSSLMSKNSGISILLVYFDNSLSFDHIRTLGETTIYLLKWSKQVWSFRSGPWPKFIHSKHCWNEVNDIDNKIYVYVMRFSERLYAMTTQMLIPVVFIIRICNDVYIMTKWAMCLRVVLIAFKRSKTLELSIETTSYLPTKLHTDFATHTHTQSSLHRKTFHAITDNEINGCECYPKKCGAKRTQQYTTYNTAHKTGCFI